MTATGPQPPARSTRSTGRGPWTRGRRSSPRGAPPPRTPPRTPTCPGRPSSPAATRHQHTHSSKHPSTQHKGKTTASMHTCMQKRTRQHYTCTCTCTPQPQLIPGTIDPRPLSRVTGSRGPPRRIPQPGTHRLVRDGRAVAALAGVGGAGVSAHAPRRHPQRPGACDVAGLGCAHHGAQQAAEYSRAQHSAAQHSTAQRSTAQHSAAQRSTAQHSAQ